MCCSARPSPDTAASSYMFSLLLSVLLPAGPAFAFLSSELCELCSERERTLRACSDSDSPAVTAQQRARGPSIRRRVSETSQLLDLLGPETLCSVWEKIGAAVELLCGCWVALDALPSQALPQLL
ncbi:unnamed protein product [Symbiodinium natans]|uniref:Uncharacterized protein n=1 Tax=Symbiodinium natans TaxID=878477 RepID=A0A812I267_9DINO|nr:unnamed protein product [Symbiodinium natans]